MAGKKVQKKGRYGGDTEHRERTPEEEVRRPVRPKRGPKFHSRMTDLVGNTKKNSPQKGKRKEASKTTW